MIDLIAQAANGKPIETMTIVFIVIGIVVFVLLCIFLYFFKVWIRALASGARVTIGDVELLDDLFRLTHL